MTSSVHTLIAVGTLSDSRMQAVSKHNLAELKVRVTAVRLVVSGDFMPQAAAI